MEWFVAFVAVEAVCVVLDYYEWSGGFDFGEFEDCDGVGVWVF